jgi:hypothetical protein
MPIPTAGKAQGEVFLLWVPVVEEEMPVQPMVEVNTVAVIMEATMERALMEATTTLLYTRVPVLLHPPLLRRHHPWELHLLHLLNNLVP